MSVITPILTREECRALAERVLAMAQGGETIVTITSTASGGFRWARNVVNGVNDSADHMVNVTRIVDGKIGSSGGNRIDDAALREMVANAERLGTVQARNPNVFPPLGPQKYDEPVLFSDKSAALDAAARSAAGHPLARTALQRKIQSAGYIATASTGYCVMNTRSLFAYYAETKAECSVTVRDPVRRASGWAGLSSFDWGRIDAAALSATALRKCEESVDPRALEPGRYTVILEPQAVADLMAPVISALDRAAAERGGSPFSGPTRGSTKIGLRVLDSRMSVLADPMDPLGGFRPFLGDGTPVHKTTWIENGVLKRLAYGRAYARRTFNTDEALPNSGAYRLTGGSSSLEQMIASSERAILVTRFHGISPIDNTLMCIGNTRDGAWLVEHGKVKYPIKNFRINESPLFVFNKVDMLGEPVRVFGPNAAVVPPVRVQDFNFIALSDAI